MTALTPMLVVSESTVATELPSSSVGSSLKNKPVDHAFALELRLWQLAPQLTCSHASAGAASPVPSSPITSGVDVGGCERRRSAINRSKLRPLGAAEAQQDLLETEQAIATPAVAILAFARRGDVIRSPPPS